MEARVRAVVYDLDGTLYEDSRPFEAYAEQLSRRLPPDRREAFRRDWEASRAGRHPLRAGTWYDPARDWVLYLDGSAVAEAYTMQGRPVPRDAWPHADARPLQLVPVGDPWWIAFCLALHHGCSVEAAREAYAATRAWMASPAFDPEPVPGLREAVLLLRQRGMYQVMATNSPKPDSVALLERLGLAGLFDECLYEAGKPQGLEALVRRLCRERGLPPGEVLAVGDNLLNDVVPAVRLGCRAVWLDRYGAGRGVEGAVRVTTSAELVSALRRAAGATAARGAMA